MIFLALPPNVRKDLTMAQEIKTQTPTSPIAPTPPSRMTYEEFLEWGDGIRAEWVDGEVIVMSPASNPHQSLMAFLGALLLHFVEADQLGRIFLPPFQMKLSTRPSGREPDLLFISKAKLSNLKRNYLEGAADMVVEIVSPDSQARDRGDKFYEYEEAGVLEYWILDQSRKRAEFYHLKEGTYKLMEPDENGIYRSTVLEGLWLKVDWLWQDPLPTLMSVLKEWGLVK
jgi:Uma2 family endonuclease